YAGQVIEEGPVDKIFQNPEHPYTQGLIKSVPGVRKKESRLDSIPGNVPLPGTIQQGCKFRDRCAFAFDCCFNEDPSIYQTSNNQKTRCFLYDKKEGANLDDKTITQS